MLLLLKKRLNDFKRNSHGVALVEFALTIVIFAVALGYFFELARLSFLSAYVDSASSLVIREVKNTEGIKNYAQEVEERLNADDSVYWLNNGRFDVSVKYFSSPNAIINDESERNPKGSAWAEYTIVYHYNPMFGYMPIGFVTKMMERRMLVLQEHEKQ